MHGGLLSVRQKSTCIDAICCRTLCGANLVTLPPKFGGNETCVVHRVGLDPLVGRLMSDLNLHCMEDATNAQVMSPPPPTGGSFLVIHPDEHISARISDVLVLAFF